VSGIILTSVLFAAMHLGTGNIPEVLFAFSASLLIGYIFYKTQSLLPAVAIHGTTNFLVLGLLHFRYFDVIGWILSLKQLYG